MNKQVQFLLPFVILFALFGLLWHALFYTKSNEMVSHLIGVELLAFKLPNLYFPEKKFTSDQLMGQVSLLHVWATWCRICNLEHDFLIEMNKKYHIPLYGILYKDDQKEAFQWLKNKGNPYIQIGNDDTGSVSIDLGIYGTPETFVISPQGRILY